MTAPTLNQTAARPRWQPSTLLAGASKSLVLRLILRRVATAIPVMWGVTLLTFVVMNLMSGGAARQLLGADATAEQVAQLEAELGLDKPAVVRYFDWLFGALSGDLGNSLASGQPVVDLLVSRAPVSIQLVGYAFIFSLVFSVPVALLAARKPDGVIDRLSRALCFAGLSIANYVFALLLVLIFAVNLRLFPAIGYIPLSEGLAQNVWSLTLPTIAIAFPLAAFYTRFLRGDLLEQMQKDYTMLAKAKGIGPWQILLRHALRNSVSGLLTIVGLNLGALIGATVVVEQIFGLSGIGKLLLEGIINRDIPIVQACVLIFAVCVIVANLLVDVFYAVLDPRIRHGQH